MRAVVCFLVCLSAFAAPGWGEETLDTNGPGYRVGVGDVLKVEAFTHDEITGEFTVEENGAITFPLLGPVEVAGRTTSRISRVLKDLLEKDYYVDVQLQVEVTDYRSQPVTVLGEVQRPGTFYLRGRTTVTQLLAEAGGLKSSAGATVDLRRVELVDGEPRQDVETFSTAKLLTGEEGADVEVTPGDVLSVSAKKLYFIHGEVARPGQYEISPGMTLMQAISQAGGLGKFSSQIVELHRETVGEKEILTFDLSHIRKGKASDPPVTSGDVLIVRRRFF
jgi:polysaccharide export outer membrane protein